MKFSFHTQVQLLTLAFLTFVITLAHASNDPAKDTIYAVQLGIFDNMTIADFEDLRGAGYLYAEGLSQGTQMSIYLSNYSNKRQAETVLQFVKNRGYDKAFISERPLVKGESVYVVQIASQTSKEYIDWQNYARGGQLYLILEGKKIKITSVPFMSMEKAKQKAKILQSLGFEGAFVKSVNTLQLHKVNQFNTIKEVNFMPVAVSTDKDSNEEGVTNEISTPISPNAMALDLTAKEPTSINKESRISVKSFQQFLKVENAYSSTLDGVFGKNTASGIAMLESSNKKYNLYKIMASEVMNTIVEESMSDLDAILLSIPADPKEAYSALTRQNSPIAKAYRAYILFIADQTGNQEKINNLMNDAIQSAYGTYKGKAPFDYTSKYAYADLEQLILHTRYIQAVLKDEPITPCWLFIKHRDAAYSAFGKATEKGIGEIKMQNCAGFMQWDNVIILKTISSDLNPDEDNLTEKQLKSERAFSSLRNRLYLIPRPLNKTQEDEIMKWNNELWKSLDLRMAEDKFFAKFGVPFKLAYHKAWIQLEDYYIEKGFKKYQANGLALAVLQSVIGVDVESYMK
ncbi:MAG: hypothetical protein ACI94Y_001589 [Maribacter sp.]|jgi:hypothetical protein